MAKMVKVVLKNCLDEGRVEIRIDRWSAHIDEQEELEALIELIKQGVFQWGITQVAPVEAIQLWLTFLTRVFVDD